MNKFLFGLLTSLIALNLVACNSDPQSNLSAQLVSGSSTTLVLNDYILGNDSVTYTALQGVFNASDGKLTEVLIYRPTSTNLDTTPLLIIPSGTGSRPEQQFDPGRDTYNHNLVLIVGFRGLLPEDSIYECTKDANFAACLKSHPLLTSYNPQQTAKDTLAVIELLNGKNPQAQLMINGQEKNGTDFFASEFTKFDLLATSYGGTVASYLAQELNKIAEKPFTIRRLVIDNGDGANAKIISQGFKLNYDRAERLFTACEKLVACNSSFPELRTNLPKWLEMHHQQPMDITINATLYQLHSSSLFNIIDGLWDDANENNKFIKAALTLAGNVTSNPSAQNVIVDLNATAPYLDSMELASILSIVKNFTPGGFFAEGAYGTSPLNLTSSNFLGFIHGLGGDNTTREFINRVGLICSSYVLRADSPDTLTEYNRLIQEPRYSPWRYGFLISYRSILELCSQLADKYTEIELRTPSDINLPIEKGLVYYGGMDVKHSLASAGNITANFANTELVIENLRGQSGGPLGDTITTQVITEFFATGSINTGLVDQANKKGLEPAFAP